MGDDKTKRGSPDNKRINVNEPYELSRWAKKFGVTPTRLRNAVNTVGTSAAKVQSHLKGK